MEYKGGVDMKDKIRYVCFITDLATLLLVATVDHSRKDELTTQAVHKL